MDSSLMNQAGAKLWLIPDCYFPEHSTPGEYISHESICVLNTGVCDAQIRITLYFEDREPMTGFIAPCPARRTHHIRMDRIVSADGKAVPRGVPYAATVESNVAVVVQYSRMDTTQTAMSLATAIAYRG